MRIALVVHGRFHAFALANALLARGHSVRVFTNYPAWAVEKFGVPRAHVTSFTAHGVLARALWKLRERVPSFYPEAFVHRMFGMWAANALARDEWDVVHPWSGVAEECLTRKKPNARYLLMRCSSHIRAQRELLAQEETRTRTPQDKPSAWMMAREEREYARADRIVTLSTFAARTFREGGIDPARIVTLPVAAESERFHPSREIVAQRVARLRAGAPLRILYVGALSFRKGLFDLAEMARQLAPERFHFRLIGPRTAETEALLAGLHARVELVPKQAHTELAQWYGEGDVFVFPTIEDGYAYVLAEAHASALPILSTENSGAPDLIRENETGWVFPIRRPDLFIERLRWGDTHRAELAEMVERVYSKFQTRTWDDVAHEFENACESARAAAA